MPNKKMEDLIKQKAEFIVSLTGFGTVLHVNDILPDLKEIAEKAKEEQVKLYESAPILEIKVENDQLWARIDTQLSKEKPNLRVIHF